MQSNVVRLTAWVCTLAVLVATAERASAVERNDCDPRFRLAPEDLFGYFQREERCEGRYHYQPLSSGGIAVLGLTEGLFDFQGRDPIWLEWPTDVPPVRIQAVRVQRRQYYRMDSYRDRPPLRWPGDVRGGLGLKPDDLALSARYTTQVCGVLREVLAPLRQGTKRLSPYFLTVVPGMDVDSVEVHVRPACPEGRPGTVAVARGGRRGISVAERPVRIALPELAQRGVYAIEVVARVSQGGQAATSALFRHDVR